WILVVPCWRDICKQGSARWPGQDNEDGVRFPSAGVRSIAADTAPATTGSCSVAPPPPARAPAPAPETPPQPLPAAAPWPPPPPPHPASRQRREAGPRSQASRAAHLGHGPQAAPVRTEPGRAAGEAGTPLGEASLTG